MLLRLLKTTMVFSCGIYFFLIADSNIIDFKVNFIFVQHVLSMDTTFQSPALMHRAITDIRIQRILYELMIAIEGTIALCCLTSSLLLARAFHNKKSFEHAKSFALVSLFLGFFYFFVGFLIIGGEWFCMWQSHVANAQPIAEFFSLLLMLILFFVSQKEGEA